MRSPSILGKLYFVFVGCVLNTLFITGVLDTPFYRATVLKALFIIGVTLKP